jgi:hypothetical protein
MISNNYIPNDNDFIWEEKFRQIIENSDYESLINNEDGKRSDLVHIVLFKAIDFNIKEVFSHAIK